MAPSIHQRSLVRGRLAGGRVRSWGGSVKAIDRVGERGEGAKRRNVKECSRRLRKLPAGWVFEKEVKRQASKVGIDIGGIEQAESQLVRGEGGTEGR